METYKAVVELSMRELNALNEMLENHDVPFTANDIMTINDMCDISWTLDHTLMSDNYSDRNITVGFRNNMLMDICFTAEVGEMRGFYKGIRFGSYDECIVEPGEQTDACYPDDDYDDGKVDGVYRINHNDDVYEVMIRAVR